MVCARKCSASTWNVSLELSPPLTLLNSASNLRKSASAWVRSVSGSGQFPLCRLLPAILLGTRTITYLPSKVHGLLGFPEAASRSCRTTNRDGYREYRSDPRICVNCPTRHLCTHSKDCVKTVQRHIWKDYEDLADDVRYTPKYQRLYKRRKETIERVFADAKEKHAMRYTQYRGLAQVSNWVKLKFAAMNLKKLACWLWKEKLAPFTLILLWQLYTRNPAYA